jgi:hypothetical protein
MYADPGAHFGESKLLSLLVHVLLACISCLWHFFYNFVFLEFSFMDAQIYCPFLSFPSSKKEGNMFTG